MKVLKINLKRILVISMIFVTLMFFLANSGVSGAAYAKSKLPAEGEFYYAGTTKGTYTVTQGIFDWLLENLGAIVDWLLGMTTMLIRMVFVGWTALIEMLLTWVLETTVNMDLGIGDINSTDVSSNTDSSKNVTVEAIVFGLVPIFDVNIFNLKMMKFVTPTGMDLTQQICETCEKGAHECTCNEGTVGGAGYTKCICNACQLKDAYSEIIRISKLKCAKCLQEIDTCACRGDECTCELCDYRNSNTILKIKETVSEWYYIIRLIAVAAMLIVLLGIGIKMLTTSIASDKALYKRMVVDWVVGMIIIFAIHYGMILIINISDSLVKIVREASISSVADGGQNATEVEGSPSFNKKKKTNANIEVSLYEEVRTRAYDAKLTNGMTGMIMYATLVYFAVRFSFVYVKRYFTIIVLTLMAPGVGIAYAIQKVLTGKSSTFSTWLTEYIMNVIIQVVHAIIYAAFVNMALKLALQSVSGIILAFVILNYMLKAEKLFKTIFKMSSGDGSLLEATDNAGDPESMKKKWGEMAGTLAAAKPIASALRKSPVTKAALGVLSAPLVGAVAGGSLIKKGLDERKERKIDEAIKSQDENYKKVSESGDENAINKYRQSDEYKNAREKALLGMRKYNGQQIQTIMQGISQGGFDLEEEQALKAALYADSRYLNKDETEEERKSEAAAKWAAYDQARKKNKLYKSAMGMSALGVAGAHIDKLLDYNNYFVPNADGKVNPIKNRKRAKWVYDENKGMPVRIDSLTSLVKDQLSAENLLGFTEQDKQTTKLIGIYAGRQMLGFASMFAGLGTCVAHPKIGVGLLAAGTATTASMFGTRKKRNRNIKRLKLSSYYNGAYEDPIEELNEELKRERFTLEKFNSGSMITMQTQLEEAYKADEKKVSEANIKIVMQKHPKLARAIAEGKAKPVEFMPELNSTANKKVERLYRKATEEKPSFMMDTVFGGMHVDIKNKDGDKVGEINYETMSFDHQMRLKKQANKERQVAIAMISEALQEEYMAKYEELAKPTEAQIQQDGSKKVETDKKTDETPLLSKTRADIKDITDIQSVIEVAILEEARTRKKDITDINIKDGNTESKIKGTIESILLQGSGMEKGQKVEEVVKDLDKEISKAKTRLDKTSKSRKETIQSILREAAEDGNSEEEFIKELTGFDFKADEETNVKNQAKRKTESSTKGLSKKEENKVVEMLLLQKQMRMLNAEAEKLHMSPAEANKRYEAARTVVANDRNNSRSDGNPDLSKRDKLGKKPNNYGPVTDIVELISKL